MVTVPATTDGSRSHRSAARNAEEGIKDHIRTHRLRPGDVLPSETHLCEVIRCSRSSLREAVCTLASLDVVEVRHGHGTFVSGMSLEPLVRGLLLRITLDPDNSLDHLRHVVETREAIDLGIATELAGRLAGQDLAEQWELFRALEAGFGAGDRSLAEYAAFHEGLYSHVGTPLIRELASAFLRTHTESFDLLSLRTPGDSPTLTDAHRALLQALTDGDPAAARTAVTAHYSVLRAPER